MYEENIFQEQAWERNGAAAVGLTLSMFRFTVAFFASIAVGAIFRFIPTVNGTYTMIHIPPTQPVIASSVQPDHLSIKRLGSHCPRV